MSMTTHKTEYAAGTFVVKTIPWGTYVTARAMCSDGRIRKVCWIAETPDTFFSVPAAVKVKNKSVSGYITIGAVSGSDVVTEDDPAIVKFIAYSYGKNAKVLP